MVRPILHMVLHLLVPGVVARVAYGPRWLGVWAIMVLTMVVDLDHLLANPLYDPNRCSLGFHPLHSWPMVGFYLALVALPKARLVGLGLVIHMALDLIDCLWMRIG